MGCALHGDFTLLSMVTPAVLGAQVNLTLTHWNECPRLYIIYLSGDMPRYCQRNLLHDLITRVFLRSLQYGIFCPGLP